MKRKKYALGIQAQNNTDIPLASNKQYDYGADFSLTHDWSSGLSAGVAYNYPYIEGLDAELIELGLTGDRQAAVAGLKYVNEPLFLSTTVTRHENHDTTDQLQYVDAWGWELYARYSFNDRLRVVGGANLLDPDSDDPQAGQYEVRSAILGIQYTYGDFSFGDMIYFECELNDGRSVAGASIRECLHHWLSILLRAIASRIAARSCR